MSILETFIEASISLIKLAVSGATAKAGMKKEVQAKLTKVFLEVRRNKTILEQSGCLKLPSIRYDDKVFVRTIKQLKNTEITPLYKVNRPRMFFPDRKKEIERRKTQYALNYVVTQIDDLHIIVNGKRTDTSPALRLSVRLRTLHKHLTTLEKVLLHIK